MSVGSIYRSGPAPIMVLADSDIRIRKDLKGKTVAMTLASVGSSIKTWIEGLPAQVAQWLRSGIANLPSDLWGHVKGLFHHSSLQGDGSPQGLFDGVAWQPARASRPIQVTSTINLDGRTIAEATSHHWADMYEFPTQAPYYNGRGGWMPPDFQTTST